MKSTVTKKLPKGGRKVTIIEHGFVIQKKRRDGWSNYSSLLDTEKAARAGALYFIHSHAPNKFRVAAVMHTHMDVLEPL